MPTKLLHEPKVGPPVERILADNEVEFIDNGSHTFGILIVGSKFGDYVTVVEVKVGRALEEVPTYNLEVEPYINENFEYQSKIGKLTLSLMRNSDGGQ